MPRAYFDTNIYGSIRAEEVEGLRAQLARRGIVAYLSLSDIEELLGGWKTNPAAATQRLRVARDLVGFDNILKQPNDLLADAIRAYAVGQSQPSQLLSGDQREIIIDALRRIALGDTNIDHVVSKFVDDVKRRKEEFGLEMAQASARARAEWELIPAERRRTVTFGEYLAAGARQWAEAFAAHIGLADACRERELDGLLNVRTVWVCVGATMSWIYSLVVGDYGQPRQPEPQDVYDLWHALLASAADVFVTRDRKLADLLERVPINGFRVVRSLDAL